MAKAKNKNKKEKFSLRNNKPLRQHTEDALTDYFATLNGDRPGDLYELVLSEIEEPLFRTVMDYAEGNQSQAAGFWESIAARCARS